MGPLFSALRRAIDADEPVVLATVTDRADSVGDATALAAKLVVRLGEPELGTLGHPELDRVVVCTHPAVWASYTQSSGWTAGVA